ncbi:hypothetical protein PRIPAC_95989, partial [Pristionchus pacificus]|uniref:Uncharacterized protein n=1 Tax=Pristionchus pacificus TaxID=54126 RepID=A0A2A6BCQ9_PRIPA
TGSEIKSLLIVLLCAAAGLTTSAVLRSGTFPSQDADHTAGLTNADQTAIRSRTSELSPVTQETDQSRVIDDPFRVYYNPCWFGIDEETNKEIMRCADGTTERKFRERANSGW